MTDGGYRVKILDVTHAANHYYQTDCGRHYDYADERYRGSGHAVAYKMHVDAPIDCLACLVAVSGEP